MAIACVGDPLVHNLVTGIGGCCAQTMGAIRILLNPAAAPLPSSRIAARFRTIQDRTKDLAPHSTHTAPAIIDAEDPVAPWGGGGFRAEMPPKGPRWSFKGSECAHPIPRQR